MAKLVAKDYHIATQPFHRFRKGGNRVFDCLCQLSDSGFQFTKQSIVCFDLPVYLAAVRDDSLSFQRTGDNALMNGWPFVQSSFCMAAMVNAFFIAVPFQITIRRICPRLAPLDKLFFAVPTLRGRILPSVFRAFRVFADSFISVLFRFGGRQIYLLAADLVRVLFLPPISLRRFEFGGGKAPFFAVSDTEIFFLGLVLLVPFFVQRANRYHDMGMRIVPGRIWIVDGNIGAHPIGDKIVLDKIRQKLLPLCRCQFNGQSRNKLTGKAAVLRLFIFLHRIP